ncbi:MAG TPA: putative phage tail protein [Caulobacteraceae bacterium]|nr:putative phage tail protein [Caulobacteraceae bacterium]
MPGQGRHLFGTDDYAAALVALLPRGRVWPAADPTTTQGQVVASLAPWLKRVDNAAQALLVDAFPASAVDLLPEWEESLGLPDPCAGEAPTLQQRERQVVARLTEIGSPSPPAIAAFAAALGFGIAIEEFAPFRAGAGHVGDPLCGEAWAHAWQVLAPLYTVTTFQAGRSAAGEPLATWGNRVLECEIRERAPAHTIVIFAYLAANFLLTESGETIGLETDPDEPIAV